MTLYHSTFGWFDAPSCKTTSVGQAYNCFPPSQIKHAALVYTDVLLLGTLSCVGDLQLPPYQSRYRLKFCYIIKLSVTAL